MPRDWHKEEKDKEVKQIRDSKFGKRDARGDHPSHEGYSNKGGRPKKGKDKD